MPARLPDVRRGRTPVRRRTPPDLCRTHGRGRTLRPAPPRGHGLPDAQHPARQHPAEHAAPPPAGDSLPRFGVAGTDGTQPDRGGALARRQFTPARTGFDTFGGGNNNASALPVRWRSNRKSCSSTNPRHPSIPRQPTPSKTCSSSWRSAIPSFSSHMGCRKPKEWPRGLSCLGKDVCKVCFRPKNSPTKQK